MATTSLPGRPGDSASALHVTSSRRCLPMIPRARPLTVRTRSLRQRAAGLIPAARQADRTRGDDGMTHVRNDTTPSIRRAATAWSRRALLWGLAWFVLLQAGLLAVMSIWRPHWRDPEYGAKMARLQQRLDV